MLNITIRDKLRLTVAVAILASKRDDETCAEATERIAKTLTDDKEASTSESGRSSKLVSINHNDMLSVTQSLLASVEFTACHQALQTSLTILQQSLVRPDGFAVISSLVSEAVCELGRVFVTPIDPEAQHRSILDSASSVLAAVQFLRVILSYFGTSLDSVTLQQINLQTVPTLCNALLKESVILLSRQLQPATSDPSPASTLVDLLLHVIPDGVNGSAPACALVVEQHCIALLSLAEHRHHNLPDQLIPDMIALYSTILSYLLRISGRTTIQTLAAAQRIIPVTSLTACVQRCLRYLRRASNLPGDESHLLQLEWELIQQCSESEGWTLFEKGHV